MSRCVIISACPVTPELAKALRPDDFIIACDAGYRNCVPLGCKPDIILGDFDTAPCPEKQDDDIIVLPHVKDDTDTEYAAKLASEKGFDEVLLLGGLGGAAPAGAHRQKDVNVANGHGNAFPYMNFVMILIVYYDFTPGARGGIIPAEYHVGRDAPWQNLWKNPGTGRCSGPPFA